jgi:predicted regulator of Ras-like GTPase activity (Roadblock/LC7/MglB family)
MATDDGSAEQPTAPVEPGPTSAGPNVPADVNPGGFKPMLEEFARECPNLRLTGIISAGDGLALNFVHAADGPLYDPEVIAAFFGDVLQAASRTVEAMYPDDSAASLQIELERELVLLRRIPGTPYQHVVIVGKDASLGVALVLMRRFQKNIAASLGG